ncbi:MAG: di-trans,poly-cis-decaprenylcistransferase, partial [Candidatus Marinimicrobia bacterium]|nr:di-trans,poly-cis-decaprenylcistransferase [Candidatus Neomarinimicrobiota bacterium]
MPDSLSIKEIFSHPNRPEHVAIIMDGNGRWARKKGFPRIAGHKEGINSVREIVEVSGEIGLKYLTLYTFSEENWKRPKTEVSFLMSLLMETLRKEIASLHKNNVKVSIIGDIDKLPEKARKGMLEGV